MGASVELSVASVEVEVGGEASLQVTARNLGSVIDELSLSVVGPAAAWTVVQPGTLSLLPGSEGTAEVTFRPPRSAAIRAGRTPFGIMAASREDPDGSVVEEGVVEVTRLVEIAAELNPRTSRGQREGTHDLTVSNRGNAPVTVAVAATDPGDLLYMTVTPPQLVIEPGGTGAARIVVQARWELEQGSPQTIPFKVTVTPEGEAPTTIDGALVQEPKEQPKPVEAAAAPAPAPAPAPPAPPKPSALPKVLAGLLALAVLGAGAVAVASGALPIGPGANKDEASATTAPPATEPETSTPPEGEPGDPQEVPFEVRASRTGQPNEEEAAEGINFDVQNAFDSDPATAWGAPGDGSGITIIITWEEPVRIREVGLIPGWADGERFAQNRTIASVSWRFRPEGAENQDFNAEPELQSLFVDRVATAVTLRISRTQEAEQGDRDFTAISEISIQ